MKSFLASQIAQHKPDAPVNTRKLCLRCPILTNLQASGTRLLAGQYQTPNKPHARENEHNDNRRKDVCMVSSLLQKQQSLLPFEFLPARIFFVKAILF